MNRKISYLMKQISASILALAMIISMPFGVLADDTTDTSSLHAGVAAVMKGEDVQSDSNADYSAGAGLLLLGDGVEVADAELDSTELDGLTDADQAEESQQEEVTEEQSTVFMANVSDCMNVREDANEEAPTVGKLYKNCGGEILEQKDGWTKIQSGELVGWAKDDYLLFGSEAEALQSEVGTLKATIKTDALRVRKEASEEAGVYGVLENGKTVKAVEELGDWVSIQYDDKTVGYVSAQYVDVDFSVEKGKTNDQIKKEEQEKEKKKLSANRGAVETAASDVTLLAALIQCEAGSQPYEGKLAVGAVVMNRVRSGSYPSSIQGVITAPSQFPPATNGSVAAVVAKGPSKSCLEAAQAAIDGASNVGGATHFSTSGQGIVIGAHVFW